MYNFITIDPGITGTGFAHFTTEDFPKFAASMFPIKNKDLDYVKRSDEIVDELGKLFKLVFYSKENKYPIYIEEPAYMGGPQHYKGQVSADSGALVKLVWHYGRLWQLFHSLGHTVASVSISKWKGQLPKEVSHNRIRQKLEEFGYHPTDQLSEHALDAIGIGFYLKNIK